MLQLELIERANQALLVAEASGFDNTVKALRLLMAEVEQIPSLETTVVGHERLPRSNVIG